MMIELRNCTLTIAHIGTREQIAIEIFYENLGVFVDQMSIAFQKLSDTINVIADQILAAFETDAGKELLKRCGQVTVDRQFPRLDDRHYHSYSAPAIYDERAGYYYAGSDNIHHGHPVIWDEKERCWKADLGRFG
ncbi:hypothetical protein M0R72_21180 [Candidatus Pacearchaeota archaeon]|jgi:hypothetical protein|nr:hypothetical protein [Candidatus Pacearchaeota archaeon]